MKAQKTNPPAHLSRDSRAWWRSIVAKYELELHHLRLLQAALEAWDRTQQARELLQRDGLVIAGREGGLRPHPAAAIERDSSRAFARLVRQLDLDEDLPPPGRR